MSPVDYFNSPSSIAQKQYEALRMFFIEKIPGAEVAKKFGYTYRGFTTISSNFRKQLMNQDCKEPFFISKKKGKRRNSQTHRTKKLVIALRKKYYSVEDIKSTLDATGCFLSERTVYNMIAEEGFTKLPRRSHMDKQQLQAPLLEAPKSVALSLETQNFKSLSAGILLLLPYVSKYAIDKAINQSQYPATKTIDKLSSILCFIALKASNARRYSADNLWCMDRGLGLFSGLNVLPKAAWYSSYSHRVTSGMNRDFLKKLNKIWTQQGLLGDTVNMDFTSIPNWGEDDNHLENNWSGKRGKALSSILAVLAQDPDSGLINYGDADVKHENESEVVLEFLDFYRSATSANQQELKYIVFDSKFTNYQNLGKLDDNQVKFLTIRRRGKQIVNTIQKLALSQWKTIRINCGTNKKRNLKVHDGQCFLKGYNRDIRQIYITGHGKIKPAIIITNDFDIKVEQVVRKYARRWIVEKAISEQIEFFHLNKVSSSMVIKVDFDLTMTILTHNIYRLLAKDLGRYQNLSILSIYEKFIKNASDIEITDTQIIVHLKKKRQLPLILQIMKQFENQKYTFLGNKKLIFCGASYS